MSAINSFTKSLLESHNLLKLSASKYNENSKKLMNAEYKINLVKAQLVSQGDIVGLPNQVMRDAKIEEILQCDPRYSEEYRNYLVLKTENKIHYTDWILAQELNKNIRVIYLAESKKGNDNEDLLS